MTHAYLFPEGVPSTAAIGQKLAEMSMLQTACELTPFVTNPCISDADPDREVSLIAEAMVEQVSDQTLWRQDSWYSQIMAHQLRTVVLPPAKDLLLATTDETALSPAAELERQARRDALSDVGWLRDGVILPAVRAAYLLPVAVKLYESDDNAETYPCRADLAQIQMAERQYKHRTTWTFDPEEYRQINNMWYVDAASKAWWLQVKRDLSQFKNRILTN